MKIVDARVVVTCPGRNFVTLKVVTDDGVTGVGDATLNGRELAVAAYLTEHVVPLLIGRDPARIEDTWQYLYQGAYWRRGPVTMSAIAAVDTALWDIKGKVAGLPVYQLLGGRCRDGVTVYGHANGETVDEALDEVAALRRPRLPRRAGADRRARAGEDLRREPGQAVLRAGRRGAADRDRVVDRRATSTTSRRCSPGSASEFGPDLQLLHDVHHRLTPIEAARLGKSLEPYALTWMEDPVPAELQEGFRLIRPAHHHPDRGRRGVQHASGTAPTLIREQLIDYIRTTVVHAGGITHLRRIFDLAALHHVRSGSHGATDLSPVCMAAALHVDISIPNFGLQEYMRAHRRRPTRSSRTATTSPTATCIRPRSPGLGVDIDEEAAARYPYRPAYLPVDRLQDGTMHPW